MILTSSAFTDTVISGVDARDDAPADVLCEVPHGATEAAHLDSARDLVGDYPDRYDDLFWVNTDQGAPEYAQRFAEVITDAAWVEANAAPLLDSVSLSRACERASKRKVRLIRALVPRTFVDFNRCWNIPGDTFAAANLTGVVGSFVTAPEDIERLQGLHAHYQSRVQAAYLDVCGRGGAAFNLHTYAPISVSIVAGEDLVTTVRRAYEPEHYPSQPRRPTAQLITALPGQPPMADASMIALLKARFEAAEIELAENHPFTLHTATTAFAQIQAYPKQVTLIELSRAALAESFVPFVPLQISSAKVEQHTAPLALAFIQRDLEGPPL